MSSMSSDSPQADRLPLLAGAAGLAVLAGFLAWWIQLRNGLVITGLSRDVSWGLYISQFTFFVGVAASAVMVVVPYYLHDFKAFSRLVVLGEVLAVSAVVVAGLFVFVDLGQPARVMNVILHPSPRSPMFWDAMSLGGYLAINACLGAIALWNERYGLATPRWVRPLVYLSIPWAVSIHTVTAFLYAGLPGRPMWETAVLAPRFLASAFASGPSLLLLVALALRGRSALDVGADAIHGLGRIVTYALAFNAFLFGVELFTAIYSHSPEHAEAMRTLYLQPESGVLPWMWGSQAICLAAFVALLSPVVRRNDRWLALVAALAFVGVWMEKGMGLVVGGFEPSPLGLIPGYSPTFLESLISVGIWGVGALLLIGGIAVIARVRSAR